MWRTLRTKLRLRRLKREAIVALHDLDDRELRDIGTFRDAIELFVDKRAAQLKHSQSQQQEHV